MTQVVLITGASSGIGYAAALAFVRHGANVVATARRLERLQQLAAAVDALPAPHGDLLTVQADVSRSDDMQRAVQQGVERFGRLDVLVANAGVGQRGAIADAEWEHLETLLRTNIDGVYHSVRAAVPQMRTSGGGHIVIVSSIVFNLVSPYAATYAASKAFVSSIAASLRLELEPEHIRVTDLLVGRTETEFNQNRLGEPGYSALMSRLPVMQVDYVAERIVRAVASRNNSRFTLRLFDRLVVLGNLLIPNVIGRRALRQYKV